MDKIAYLENSDFSQDGKFLVNDPTICLIYANWCPPCTAFKPIYYELAGVVNNVRIACIELDGHLPGQEELGARVKTIFRDLEGTPSIYMLKDGKVAGRYDGERTLDGLLAFCNQY
jgi:thiol-disulfide isomerase/thioredoxin